MSALSSQVAPITQTEMIAAQTLSAAYPEETRFVVDYRLKTVSPTPRPSLLVRRRKRSNRRSVR